MPFLLESFGYSKTLIFLTLNTKIVVKGNIMNKRLIITLTSTLIYGTIFAATTEMPQEQIKEEISHDNLQIMRVSDLTQDLLMEIAAGSHPEIVVKFIENDIYPLNLALFGDLVNLKDNNNQPYEIQIMQTIYARIIKEELFLSVDLKDWKPCLEFITGHFSISFEKNEGKPRFSLICEANQRK